uniref:DNA 3'-5' helicase n=2 Tax=Guillardia theta TaxID=55529 RepID=A0A7S4L1D7_GUITH
MKQGCANKENKQAQSSSDHTEDSHKWIDMPKPDKHRVKRLGQSLSLAQAHGTEAATLDDEMRFLLEFYEKTLAECKSLDFSSLISRANKLLRENEEAKNYFHDMYKAVLVDEFQDTSRSQFELVKQLVTGGKITAVGDDDQTIYVFNGSNHANFDLFRGSFPNYKEVKLTTNYRSSKCIVDAARSVIQHNQNRCDKSAEAMKESGELIRVTECRNEKSEISFVVQQIVKGLEEGTRYKEVAILYRTQKTGRVFQQELIKRDIPFNVHGVSFWRRKVIKVVMSVLRIVANNGDDQACRRLIKGFLYQDKEATGAILNHLEKFAASRCISLWQSAQQVLRAKFSGSLSKKLVILGRKMLSTVENFIRLARESTTLSTFVETIIPSLPQSNKYDLSVNQEEAGAQLLNEKKDNRSVREVLLGFIKEFEKKLMVDGVAAEWMCQWHEGGRTSAGGGEVLSPCQRAIAVFLDHQLVEESEHHAKFKFDNEDAVTLSTIHQSKGLEWDVVHLVRFNAGEIPLANNINTVLREDELEDERRLCYVAMTRARRLLHMSFIMTSHNHMLEPSPFLSEIPSHLLQRSSFMESGRSAEGREGEQEQEQEQEGEEAIQSDSFFSCGFLQRFEMQERRTVAAIFHRWARTEMYKEPNKLVFKIKCIVQDKLAAKDCKTKSVYSKLLAMLRAPEEATVENFCASAINYAKEVVKFEQAPLTVREEHKAKRARHFSEQYGRSGMEHKEPTAKQLAFLKSLGCAVVPKNMLEASLLIERYKSY